LCLLSATAFLLGFYIITHAYTAKFRDGANNESEMSVASLERVKIRGVDQWLLIRGERKTNPILLFLPGGPGLSLIPVAHKFQPMLEKDFVVVHWDQRGAGKSHSFFTHPEITEEDLVSDAHEVIELLRRRFQQPKIYLVGHSWGTYLGMRIAERYPDLIYAYIGAGQMSDDPDVEKAQARFVKEKTRSEPPANLHTAVISVGGDLRGMNSSFPVVKEALKAHEYSYIDYVHVVAGLFYYLHYNPALRQVYPRVTKLHVPIYFFVGREDYITPVPLTVAYFNKIQAPRKRLVWFENSAHWTFYEEPDKFRDELRRIRKEVEPSSPTAPDVFVQLDSTNGDASFVFRCSARGLYGYLRTRPVPAQDSVGDYFATVGVKFDDEMSRPEVWSEWDSFDEAAFVPNPRRFAHEFSQHHVLALTYVPEGLHHIKTVRFVMNNDFSHALLSATSACK
jgi:pimeloyl-ACP methyl ester carboxylesterase